MMLKRLKNILEAWGLIEKPPVIEEVIGSLPTTGYNDNGDGWCEVEPGIWQRKVNNAI